MDEGSWSQEQYGRRKGLGSSDPRHIFQVGKQTQSKVVALPSSLGVEMNERPSLLTSIQCPFYYCSEDKSKEGVCTCMCVSVCVRMCACVHMSTGSGEPYLGIKLCTG